MTAFSAPVLPIVNMLWFGSPIGAIQRLSMISFLEAGHAVRFHSYDEVDVPVGVELVDAARTMPREEFASIRSARNPSYSTAANGFRLRLLQQSAGLWADADVVCLKPIEVTGTHLFGWQSEDLINNAVLFLSGDSPILRDLAKAFRPWGVPYWVSFRKRMEIRARRMLRMPHGPADLIRGTFGPNGLTAVAKHHGLLAAAKPAPVFYPIPYEEASWFYDPAATLEPRLADDTLCVHLWYEVLVSQGFQHATPPKSSPLGRLMSRFGV